MDLYEELLTLIDLFEEKELDYALCGGIAVAFHGYARFTKDIDFLVLERDIDKIKMIVAGQGFSFDSGRIPFGVGTDKERIVYRISKVEGDETLSLDFVFVSSLLESVWEDREVFSWQNRQVHVVSAEGLAVMKRIAGRDQDLLDLKQLGFTEESDDEKG